MKKQETVGFQLSAAVPLDRVGFVLKAFFDNGCPLSSLDLKALIGVMPNGHGNGHVIEGSSTPQQLDKPKRGRPPKHGRAMQIRQATIAFVKEQGRVSRVQLHAHLRTLIAEGFQTQTVDTVVLDFVKKGVLVRPYVGLLEIAEGTSKPEPALPDEPIGLKGNFAFAYSIIRAEPERRFTIADIQDSFTASGRNRNSVKDCLIKLRRRGFIHRPEPGMYTL